MVKLKELLLAALVITSLNNYSCKNSKESNCKNMQIVSQNVSINLDEGQYSISEIKSGFEVAILDEKILDSIAKVNDPQIFFCFENNKIALKGNPLLNSSTPKDVNGFFPLSLDNKIYFSNRNKILISLVDKIGRGDNGTE